MYPCDAKIAASTSASPLGSPCRFVMSNARSVVVPWAYSTMGRVPRQCGSPPSGTISAPDAEVASFAPPTVAYRMRCTAMSHSGVPLTARNCWLVNAVSASSKAGAVTVDTSSGGLCSNWPRVGFATTAPEPGSLPPHAASASAVRSKDVLAGIRSMEAGPPTGSDSTTMQACAVRHCQSVRWRTGSGAFEARQCTLTHRTPRNMRLRCERAECDLPGRSTATDGKGRPRDSLPLPEEFP